MYNHQVSTKAKRAPLFYPQEVLSPSAIGYIEYGKNTGVSVSYKCRTRSPWWRVPGVRTADAFFTYMNGAGPNICSNDARVAHLNSVHGIYFDEDTQALGKAVLPLLSLSSVTQLSAEVRGRSYGGGILKVEPREAVRLVIPTIDAAKSLEGHVKAVRQEADLLLASGRRTEVSHAVDQLLVAEGLLSEREANESEALLGLLSARRKTRSKTKAEVKTGG